MMIKKKSISIPTSTNPIDSSSASASNNDEKAVVKTTLPFKDRTNDNKTTLKYHDKRQSSTTTTTDATTATTATTTIQARKQLFEAINHQNKSQNQLLVYNNNKKKNEQQQSMTYLDVDCYYPFQRNKRRTTGLIWKLWQGLYAIVAILELYIFCQHNNNNKLSSCQNRNTMMVMDSMFGWLDLDSDLPYCTNNDNDREDDNRILLRNIVPPMIVHMTFICFMCLQTMVQSWNVAFKSTQQQQLKEEGSAQWVTRRTKARGERLETTSTNRHWMARWTRNRIRWKQTTTEILKWAIVGCIVRLLFVPVLHENPFVKYFGPMTHGNHNKPWFLSIGKQQKVSVNDAQQSLLSVAEAIFSIFHSKAVTKIRRQIKAFVVHMVKILLSQPWKVSGRVQQIFKAIRWAKFLAPLIGTCNKLRGHFSDYQKKKLQRQRSKKAIHSWEQVVILAARQGATTTKKRLTMDQAARILQHRYKVAKSEKGTKRVLPKSTPPRLLLRPNTDFAVNWKRITITCVLFEIAQLVLAPQLTPHSSKVPIEELVKRALTPSLEHLLDSFPRLQLHLVAAVPWISLLTAEMVSAVSFLDVFVTFFTGELDAAGLLVPKDFFSRWILPGVVLQLIVNPTLKDAAHIVGKCITFCQSVGPMRAFHIIVALVPIMEAIVHVVLDTLLVFVYKQNRRDMHKQRKRELRKKWS